MYWCFHCYAGQPAIQRPMCSLRTGVEGPPGRSSEDQLVWALGHPDGDRAVLAAKTLGVRRVRAALPALRRVVDDGTDPFLAWKRFAARSRFAGRDELRGWLEGLAESDSFMVSAVARHALA